MKRFIPLSFTVCFFLTSHLASSQSVFTNAENVAIGGYDVIAYHNAHEAIRGSNDYTASLNGATYYFSSAANQKSFQANPDNYLPEFGGYCAFAVAMKGTKVPSNPTTFKIRDGKLYLFFNDYYEGKPFNTIIPWNGSEKDMLSKAITNWNKISK